MAEVKPDSAATAAVTEAPQPQQVEPEKKEPYTKQCASFQTLRPTSLARNVSGHILCLNGPHCEYLISLCSSYSEITTWSPLHAQLADSDFPQVGKGRPSDGAKGEFLRGLSL